MSNALAAMADEFGFQGPQRKLMRAVFREAAGFFNWETERCNPNLSTLAANADYRDQDYVRLGIRLLEEMGVFTATFGRNRFGQITLWIEWAADVIERARERRNSRKQRKISPEVTKFSSGIYNDEPTDEPVEEPASECARANPIPDVILTGGQIVILPPEPVETLPPEPPAPEPVEARSPAPPAPEPVDTRPPEPPPAVDADPARPERVLVNGSVDTSREDTRPPRAHTLPDGWQANAEGRAYARQHGYDPDGQAVRMANKALAKGWTATDWQARFRQWIDDEPSFTRSGGGGHKTTVQVINEEKATKLDWQLNRLAALQAKREAAGRVSA